jgi:undecaprenyl-diphosphatase
LTAIEAALLGLIQGLTEFLPVSSSGHLALGQVLLGIDTGDVTFEIIVHFGTVLAILTALRERVMLLILGCLRRDRDAWHMVLLLGIGTIPAGLVGVLFKKTLETAFNSPLVVSGFLIATGVILWSTRFAKGNRTRLTVWDAILIGSAQALAVLPGISRSGSTIGMGLWRGVDGREAATFSFLLSIPIIVGATVLEVRHLVAYPLSADALLTLVIGAFVAYGSGVFAIRWLLGLMGGGKLGRFAYYCWLVGLIGVGYFWA